MRRYFFEGFYFDGRAGLTKITVKCKNTQVAMEVAQVHGEVAQIQGLNVILRKQVNMSRKFE